jgi:D-aminopeptidase
MFMASTGNASQVRLVFLSQEDIQSAGLNTSSLNATEVPVQVRTGTSLVPRRGR